jgi:hypothetical protein
MALLCAVSSVVGQDLIDKPSDEKLYKCDPENFQCVECSKDHKVVCDYKKNCE